MSRQDELLALPSGEQVADLEYTPSLIAEPGVTIFGFLHDTEALLAYPNLELVNLRHALNVLPDTLVSQVIRAQQLIHYQITNRYCGRCGEKTVLNPATNRLSCPGCRGDVYPQIAPAMIVAVTKGDKLLMAQANHFAPTMWSILAGFCEIGENLEETVEREVFEEVGIKVKNIRYWGSQYWPFPNSLMVGFTAEYAEGEIKLDHSEMRAAGFYAKDEIPGRPSTSLSIASRMIDDFIAKN